MLLENFNQVFSPILSVDVQSNHVLSFVRVDHFSTSPKQSALYAFLYISASRLFTLMVLPCSLLSLPTSSQCQGVSDLLASSEMTCSSHHHYLLPSWHSHSAFLTFALVLKLLPLARYCSEIMPFIMCSVSVFLHLSFHSKACKSILYPRNINVLSHPLPLPP